jgi:cytoskeleton protein RodZ
MSDSEAENIPSASVDTESPGVLLKRAREKLKLTPEAISTRLRLSKKVIKHIENDEYENLPAAIFVKGYLKSYANMVDLPNETIINAYQNYVKATETDISLSTAHLKPFEKNQPFTGLLLFGGILIAVLAAAGYWYAVQPSTETIAKNDAADASSATSRLAFEEEPQSLDTASNLSEQPATTLNEPADEPETTAVEEEELPEATTSQSAMVEGTVEPEVVPPATPGKNELILEFKGDSWVDISDAQGKRLVYRMVKAGDKRVVSGTPPFKLTLGNAPEIDLYNNGVKVNLIPYTRGKVAKFRLGDIDDQ